MSLPPLYISVLIIFILLGFLFALKKSTKKEKRSHKWRKESAKKTLQKIQHMENPQIFSYLRKVDPFVFEEMILEVFRNDERCKVVESDRYTGDGGIDGEFIFNKNGKKMRIIIQAKRYNGHINIEHVKEFCKLLQNKKYDKGFFIHTGKTGSGSKQEINRCNGLELISGSKLINLLKYRKF